MNLMLILDHVYQVPHDGEFPVMNHRITEVLHSIIEGILRIASVHRTCFKVIDEFICLYHSFLTNGFLF